MDRARFARLTLSSRKMPTWQKRCNQAKSLIEVVAGDALSLGFRYDPVDTACGGPIGCLQRPGRFIG
jgi:hypothetical protein